MAKKPAAAEAPKETAPRSWETFRPLRECLIVLQEPEQHTTDAGIIVPGRGPQHAPRFGRVLRCGAGRLVTDGGQIQTIPHPVQPGDTVAFMHLAGYPVKLPGYKLAEGEELRIIRDTDIIGIDNGTRA